MCPKYILSTYFFLIIANVQKNSNNNNKRLFFSTKKIKRMSIVNNTGRYGFGIFVM